MLHAYVGTTEAPYGEVGSCTCGWQSLPRRREGGALDAVFRHRDRLGGEPLHVRSLAAARVDTTNVRTVPLPPGVHVCARCGRPFPKRPGRYPRRCDECRAAA